MRARALVFVGIGLAALALAGCGAKPAQSATTKNAQQTAPVASVSPAQVASLLDPCTDNRPGFAHNLCSTASLASLDTQIRNSLQTQATNLSNAGAQMLVQNQQRWREAQRLSCGVLDAVAVPTQQQRQCLEAMFRTRLGEVRDAIQTAGGYTFERVELLDAAPVTAALRASSGLGDDAPPAILRDIRYPRIDTPQTQQTQRFNELVAQEPQFRLQDATSETVTYRIAYAGPDIISVRIDSSADQLGAAHPSDSSKAVTVLMRSGRLLEASDVFRDGSGWEDFITQRAMRDLTRQYQSYDFTPSASDVRETATKPHLWLVTEAGLVLLFPPYSFGGPTALDGAEVTIPWADLRRYLNPNAPTPIRASA
ncbi:MAG: RsiV family protein [Pseudomonadota bacterium]